MTSPRCCHLARHLGCSDPSPARGGLDQEALRRQLTLSWFGCFVFLGGTGGEGGGGKALSHTRELVRPSCYLEQADFLFQFQDVIFCLYCPFL